jgi:hypothetical protein
MKKVVLQKRVLFLHHYPKKYSRFDSNQAKTAIQYLANKYDHDLIHHPLQQHIW